MFDKVQPEASPSRRTTSRNNVRRLLERVFPTSSQLDGFVIDFFHDVSTTFAPGMDRTERINRLLLQIPPEQILAALQPAEPLAVETPAHFPVAAESPSVPHVCNGEDEETEPRSAKRIDSQPVTSKPPYVIRLAPLAVGQEHDLLAAVIQHEADRNFPDLAPRSILGGFRCLRLQRRAHSVHLTSFPELLRVGSNQPLPDGWEIPMTAPDPGRSRFLPRGKTHSAYLVRFLPSPHPQLILEGPDRELVFVLAAPSAEVPRE